MQEPALSFCSVSNNYLTVHVKKRKHLHTHLSVGQVFWMEHFQFRFNFNQWNAYDVHMYMEWHDHFLLSYVRTEEGSIKKPILYIGQPHPFLRLRTTKKGNTF
jgi:hypothetical protein